MAYPAPAPPTETRLPVLRAPVFVGVTGHRFLDDDARLPLQRDVRATLKALQSRLPNTPFVLLTALAEGADLLVAEAALDLGWSLLAPLPMEPMRYAKTFESPEAAARMQELIDAGIPHEVIGPKQGKDVDGYVRVEAYLARHAHLLVALWDGEPAGGLGGTAHVVHTARTSLVELKKVHEDLRRQEEIQRTPSIPVLWFPTRRPGQEARRSFQDGVALLPPLRQEDEHPSEEPVPLGGRRAALECIGDYLRPASEWNRLLKPMEEGLQDPSLVSSWDLRRDVIDAEALTMQKATRRLHDVRIGMVAIGFLVLEMAVGPLGAWKTASLVGLALLALGTFGLARRNHHLERRFLQARTLAEHLRIRGYLEGSPLKATRLNLTHHLRLVAHPGDVLCHVLDAWEVIERHQPSSASEKTLSLPHLLKDWVQGQVKYFQDKAPSAAEAERKWGRISNSLLVVGLCLSTLLAVTFVEQVPEWLKDLRDPFLFLGTAAILGAAAIRTRRQYRAFGPRARRYRQAMPQFTGAATAIREAIREGDETEAWECLHQLADQAMRENSEWFAMHLERPPDAEI